MPVWRSLQGTRRVQQGDTQGACTSVRPAHVTSWPIAVLLPGMLVHRQSAWNRWTSGPAGVRGQTTVLCVMRTLFPARGTTRHGCKTGNTGKTHTRHTGRYRRARSRARWYGGGNRSCGHQMSTHPKTPHDAGDPLSAIVPKSRPPTDQPTRPQPAQHTHTQLQMKNQRLTHRARSSWAQHRPPDRGCGRQCS